MFNINKKHKQPSLHKAMRYQKYSFGITLILLNLFNLFCLYYTYGFDSFGKGILIFSTLLFIPGIYVIIRTYKTPTRFDDDKDLILITITAFIIIALIFGTFSD